MKKHAVTARCLFVCSALLLFANAAYGGRYQRTKDGQTLVWNNLRGWADEATWSGDRDPNGYASGEGTLTWSRGERKSLTGFHIPFAHGRSVVVSRYSGKMVRGKFDGVVVSVDAKGKTFHGTFVNGNKVSGWSRGPAPAPAATPDEQPPAVAASPEGSAPPAGQRRKEGVVVKAPTQGNQALELFNPPSSLRTTVAATASPQASIPSTPSQTTTTTTTTEGSGTITEFTPGSTIVLTGSSGPRTYRFGKTVTYATKSGKVLDEDTMRTKIGVPVHVHYVGDMLVDRVILDED